MVQPATKTLPEVSASASKVLPCPPSTLEGAQKVFDLWGSAARDRPDRRRKLSEDSVEYYRAHWNKWVAWLSSQEVMWNSATVPMIERYLASVPPRANGRSTDTPSTVTRRRYWRLLRDIYGQACTLSWMTTNPCEGAADVPGTEASDSMVLPPHLLHAIHQGLVARHDARKQPKWQDLRDDALLLVMLHTAIKSGEVQFLTLNQVIHISTGRRGGHFILKLDGKRNCQERQIPVVDADAKRILAGWLGVRKEVVMEGTPWLFFSQKTMQVGEVRMHSHLSRKSVFGLVSQAIKTLVPAGSGPQNFYHVGGETLRNSVIASWLKAGRELEEVAQLAGVAELRALTRLK